MSGFKVGFQREYIYPVGTPIERQFPGYSIIGYTGCGYGGFITVIWPIKWPPPCAGQASLGCAEGILPKEMFGGKGGVEVPNKPVPEIRPDYEVCKHEERAR